MPYCSIHKQKCGNRLERAELITNERKKNIMEKMKALYEKVAGDSGLQAKFAEIMSKAEAEGAEATKAKLVEFAKEAGYEVSMEDVKEYFEKLSEKNTGELTDGELDMVAGGKSTGGTANIVMSVLTLGLTCGIQSAASIQLKGGCGQVFE
jgi:predicted ribosomally synthesized peptide with nif11-like leader